jgi:hypothetical protein
MQVGLLVPQGWKGEYDGWQPSDAWARSVELARDAEDVGFESLWVFDHLHTVPTLRDQVRRRAQLRLSHGGRVRPPDGVGPGALRARGARPVHAPVLALHARRGGSCDRSGTDRPDRSPHRVGSGPDRLLSGSLVADGGCPGTVRRGLSGRGRDDRDLVAAILGADEPGRRRTDHPPLRRRGRGSCQMTATWALVSDRRCRMVHRCITIQSCRRVVMLHPLDPA